jgi:hypothetical protein
MQGKRTLVFWFIMVMALSITAQAQRGRYVSSRSGHFSRGHLSFQGRGYGFSGHYGYTQWGYGRYGHLHRFRPYSPYGFHSDYSPFRYYYGPFGYYRGYYRRPSIYSGLYFGFASAPYPYYSVPFYYPYLPNTLYWPEGTPTYEPTPDIQRRKDTQGVADRVWLVALIDGTIRAVKDYGLKDDTLTYVTRDGQSSSVPLSEVDLSFTIQLNRERGLEFRLPRPLAE